MDKKQQIEEMAHLFCEYFKNGICKVKLKERLCEECSGCYIPNCFETPTEEFAYNAKEAEKIIDELLK